MADNKNLTVKIIGVALGCSILGSMAGVGGMIAYSTFKSGNDTATADITSSAGELQIGQRDATELDVSYVSTDREMTASEIYSANVNSTVGITTSVTTNYFGYQTTAAASGSGFIITSTGYILTNYHVVEDATDIKVTLYDDTTYKAELVGCDEDNDIAVLKVDAKGLTPVVLGDSDLMSVGDSVIAIGNPLGELTFSLTQGVVSALDRKVTIENKSMNLIQTDCAINSGNSGGALFNKYGEVIGITNAKYSSSGSSSASIDNVGFAIPVNNIMEIVKSIIENGYIVKPYIGADVYELGSRYQISGLLVRSVDDDSPAEEAGLKTNDVITAVNGKAVSTVSGLKDILSGCKEGDTLELSVYRNGDTIDIDVEVTMHQQSAQPSQSSSEGTQTFDPSAMRPGRRG